MLTGKCNEACPFCYGARKPVNSEHGIPLYQNQRPEISTGEVKDIIDLFYSIGVRAFNIGGGEPTLRKDLVEILQHIKSKEEPVLTYLSTNALLLSQDTELRRTLYNLVDIFGLSLDGATSEANMGMGRVRNHWQANREFIRQVSEEERVKAVKIGTIVSSVNKSDIVNIGTEIRTWLTETPFNLVAWRLFQFSPIEEGHDNRSVYEISEAEFNNVATQVKTTFTDISVVERPHSVAENAYFLVMPTGELALARNAMHEPITELLTSLDAVSLAKVIQDHSDTVDRVEQNRRWLTD